MSYTKTTWSDGDIITANKMNNIEIGVESLNTDVGQLQTDLDSLTETVENLPTGGGDVPADYQELVDDVSQIKADLSYTNKTIFPLSELDLSKYTGIKHAISTSNAWSTSGYSKFILVENLSKPILIVTGNSVNGSVISPLKTDSSIVSGAAQYATGMKRTFVPAGETVTFELPDDCVTVNVLTYWNDHFVPESILVYESEFNNINEKFNDYALVADEIGLTVDEGWTDSYCVVSTYYNSSHALIQGTTATASQNLSASPFVPVRGRMLQIPMIWTGGESSYPNYGMSLYDENRQPIYGRAVTAYINKTENDPFVVWLNIYLPREAKYFRTTYWSEAARTEYSIPAFTYNLLMEIPDEYKPITHELPVDTYMQNAIRRARQLTDIKWTPRVNIPRYSMIGGGDKHFLDWFYADHEYTGIPYSGAGDDETHWSTIKEWGYTHNWVGQHIPISAFVTAARYPNSIMGEKADQSIVSYDSSPYGDVCTALVNYVVDGPTPLRGITNFFTTTGDAAFRTDGKTIANSNMNDICIGDFLYTKAHVIFISDLMRDANGNITHIEMSEETTVGNYNNAILGTKFGGVARRKMWDINDFKSAYASYIRYRRVTFYGIPYIKSPYVDTGNEGDMNTFVDMACIPYLGEGAIYRVNYIHNSKVLIGATGFTSLVVTKDGEPFNTFDITGLTEISVGFSEIGSYEAYLSDGTTQTRSCHWTVVE